MKDESGHWYCIPVEHRARFEDLAAKLEDGIETEEDMHEWETKFLPAMLNSHVTRYSFTDLRPL